MDDFKPKRSQKRLFLVVASGLVLAILVVRARFSKVELILPESIAAFSAQEVMGTGTIESVAQTSLAFEMQGRLSWIGVDEGDLVQEGQALARLENNQEERAVSVAEASRKVALAAVDGALAEIARATATRDRLRADFSRAEQMKRDGAISPADHDQAAERYKTAEATLRALQAAHGQASQSVTAAGRTVGLQRTKVDDMVLRSPMNGLVVRRHHEVGDVPGPGESIFTVISLKKLWARAWVDESELEGLKVGSAARVELRSHPGKYFKGAVDRIGREVDRQTHELLVDIELLERPERFAVGTRVDVWITSTGRGALVADTLPAQATGVAAAPATEDKRAPPKAMPAAETPR